MIFQSQSLASESVFGVAQISSTSQPQIQPHAEDLHLPPPVEKENLSSKLLAGRAFAEESFLGR